MITNNPTITGINGQISLTNDAIEAEVSRATGEEGRIEASIAVTAGEVAIQVVEYNAYLIQSGIDIIPAGIEISGGKYVKIKTGGLLTAESGNFNIDASGNVSMTGSITSTSGSIAGWQINPTTLTGNKTGLAKTTNDADIAIWAGNTTASSAPFRVTQGGKLYATGAVISGNSTFEGTLSANCINGGSIDASDVTITNLNASNITTGSMSAGLITSGTMSANRISGGSIDASDVTITNLNASNITSGSMSAGFITSGTMSANRISGGSIDATDVTITNLNASNIASGTMSANRISGGSIDATDVTITNLNASNITSGTMSASKINGGTLTLGGAGNADGVLVVKNAAGTEIGRWDNNGISASAGTFSGNVSGATITGGSLNIGDGNCIIDSGGNVTLKSLNIATEEGGTTTVNLTGYPMWKLYYASVKSVSVTNGYCTSMTFTNAIGGVSSVNFKHAPLVSTVVLGEKNPHADLYYVTVSFNDESTQTGSIDLSSHDDNVAKINKEAGWVRACSKIGNITGSSGSVSITIPDSTKWETEGTTSKSASINMGWGDWSEGSRHVTVKLNNSTLLADTYIWVPSVDSTNWVNTSGRKWRADISLGGATRSSSVKDFNYYFTDGQTDAWDNVTASVKATYGSGKNYSITGTATYGSLSKSKATTLVATEAYEAGWGAAYGKVTLPANGTSASMAVKTPPSTVDGTATTTTYTVSADNTYAYIKVGTAVKARATHSAFSNGQTDAGVSVDTSASTVSRALSSSTKSVAIAVDSGTLTKATGRRTVRATAGGSLLPNTAVTITDYNTGKTDGYDSAKVAKSWSGATVTLSKSTSGSDSVSLTVGASAGISYNSSAHTYTASAQASCDGANRASDTATSGTEAYEAGQASITVTDVSLWDGDTQLSGDVSIGVGGSKTIQAWCKRAGTWVSGSSITVRGPYLPDTGSWSYDMYQGKFQPKVTILGKTYYSTYLYTGLAT